MTPQLQLRALVAALLDDERPGELLALGPTAAAVAMPDGTMAAIFTIDHGAHDVLVAQLRAVVEHNPTAHLKLCLLGGDASAAEIVAQAQPRVSMRRAVQGFHLRHGGELWVGRSTRADSPLGRHLSRIATEAPTPPALADLAARVRSDPRPPEHAALEREHRTFVARMKGARLRATPIMLVALLAVFGLQMWFGGALPPVLVRMGANTHDSLHGEPERLLAAAFLHGGGLHVMLNAVSLWMLGGFVERLLGAAHLVVCVIVAAAIGSVASAGIGGAELSVGASGGICGLLGAAAVLAFRPAGVLPPSVVPAIRRAAMINLVLVGSMSMLPGIDMWAHLGGGIAGAAYAAAILTRLGRPGTIKLARAAAFGLTALAVGSLALAIARGRPWQLREPVALVERALPGGVTIVVPLGRGQPRHYPAAENDGIDSWVFGDLRRDPIVVLVHASPHDVPDAELVDEARALAEGPVPVPEGARADGPWRYVEEAPHPTLEATWTGGDLVGHPMAVVLPGVLLEIETRRYADGPDSAVAADAAVHDALVARP